MSKISVVYWSQTGNTEAMAEAVGAGIAKAGKEADVVEVSSASMEDLKAAKVFKLFSKMSMSNYAIQVDDSLSKDYSEIS